MTRMKQARKTLGQQGFIVTKHMDLARVTMEQKYNWEPQKKKPG